MTQRQMLLASAVVMLTLAVAGHAQQPAPPQRAPDTVTQGVTAVLVDVVVRDRRGQPVRDLTQADFQVFEEGVAQPIGSFSRVSDGATVPLAETKPTAPPTAPGGVSAPAAAQVSDQPVTAIVFDRLSPEARRLAVQAAQSYLGGREEAPGFIGVFGIDLALTPYAPFTRNTRVLRQALSTIASRGSSSFNSPEHTNEAGRLFPAAEVVLRRLNREAPRLRTEPIEHDRGHGLIADLGRRWGAHAARSGW